MLVINNSKSFVHHVSHPCIDWTPKKHNGMKQAGEKGCIQSEIQTGKTASMEKSQHAEVQNKMKTPLDFFIKLFAKEVLHHWRIGV